MLNHKKLSLLVVLSVLLPYQLCHANVIASDQLIPRNVEIEPENVDGVNLTEDGFGKPTTMASRVASKMQIIIDQNYVQNVTGEYKHEIILSNGHRHVEQGEYEDRNGTNVFVIRGVFSYFTKEGTYKTSLYIVDENGYRNIEPPPQLTQDGAGLVDYRPDVQEECDAETNSCLIDPKLLALLVG